MNNVIQNLSNLITKYFNKINVEVSIILFINMYTIIYLFKNVFFHL